MEFTSILGKTPSADSTFDEDALELVVPSGIFFFLLATVFLLDWYNFQRKGRSFYFRLYISCDKWRSADELF